MSSGSYTFQCTDFSPLWLNLLLKYFIPFMLLQRGLLSFSDISVLVYKHASYILIFIFLHPLTLLNSFISSNSLSSAFKVNIYIYIYILYTLYIYRIYKDIQNRKEEVKLSFLQIIWSYIWVGVRVRIRNPNIRSYHLQKDSFTSSFLFWMSFISFSYLTPLARTSINMLNRDSDSGHPFLIFLF